MFTFIDALVTQATKTHDFHDAPGAPILQNKTILNLAMATMAAATLVACGGGSSGTAASNAPLSANFVDAPVRGLCYAATPSGLAGTTDAAGAYQYRAGDVVSFSIPSNGACDASALVLGSATPVAAATGSTQTFVLSLANGSQIAEVLNALNHGSSTAMDVSGLAIPAAQVSTITTYINSGTTPASQTALAMLAALQTSATLPNGSSYTTVTDSNFAAAVSQHLAASAGTLTTAASISLTDLPGKLAFRQTSDGSTNFIKFDSLTQLSYVDPFTDGGGVGSRAITVSGSTVNFPATSGQSAFSTQVVYKGANRIVYNQTRNGVSSGGSLFLMAPQALADVAGKTVTFPSNGATCQGQPIDGNGFTFSADGSVMQSRTYANVAFTVSIDPTITGLLKLVKTDGSGKTMYLGMAQGGNWSTPGSTVHQVTTQHVSGDGQPAVESLQIIANPTTVSVCPSGGSSGAITLTASQVVLRYVSSSNGSVPGPLATLPSGAQLCIQSYANGVTNPIRCGQYSDGSSPTSGNEMVLDTVGFPAGSQVSAYWNNPNNSTVSSNPSNFTLNTDGSVGFYSLDVTP